ncbi:MAG TPA: hypothetical protein VD997_00285 [Phycisphaerales bacterium]|nr:hypothetical protein [Phycisphaerales bacterium]
MQRAVALVVGALAVVCGTQAQADYVIVSWHQGRTFRVNETTGAITHEWFLPDGGGANNIARSPVTGEVWVTSYQNGRADRLYRLDPLKGFAPEYVQLNVENVRALAFDGEGVLYAAVHVTNTYHRTIHVVNSANGHCQQIAQINSTPLQGMTFMPDGSVLGVSVNGSVGTSALHRIQRSTWSVAQQVPVTQTPMYLQDVGLRPDGTAIVVGSGSPANTGDTVWTVNTSTGVLGPFTPGVTYAGDYRGIAWVPPPPPPCGSSDYNGDGDAATDQDIEAFFACMGGHCCEGCLVDFNGDGDDATDQDIEAFFRVIGGGTC